MTIEDEIARVKSIDADRRSEFGSDHMDDAKDAATKSPPPPDAPSTLPLLVAGAAVLAGLGKSGSSTQELVAAITGVRSPLIDDENFNSPEPINDPFGTADFPDDYVFADFLSAASTWNAGVFPLPVQGPFQACIGDTTAEVAGSSGHTTPTGTYHRSRSHPDIFIARPAFCWLGRDFFFLLRNTGESTPNAITTEEDWTLSLQRAVWALMGYKWSLRVSPAHDVDIEILDPDGTDPFTYLGYADFGTYGNTWKEGGYQMIPLRVRTPAVLPANPARILLVGTPRVVGYASAQMVKPTWSQSSTSITLVGHVRECDSRIICSNRNSHEGEGRR